MEGYLQWYGGFQCWKTELHRWYCGYIYIYIYGGGRLIGISRSLIWSKTLMELMFNPCGEFQWNPEGPVSQIHSSHLLVDVPGIFKVFSDAKERVGCGKQREVTAPIKSLVKLQPWFLSLQWKTCLWQPRFLPLCRTLMMMIYMDILRGNLQPSAEK